MRYTTTTINDPSCASHADADTEEPSRARLANAARNGYRELLDLDEHGETLMAPEATETILTTIAIWGVPILKIDEEEAHRTWIWADLHLRDRASVRIHKRPFWTWRTHDRALMRRWRRTVGPTDTTIHVGDFSSEFIQEGARRALLDSLPGRKINVLGNHDIAGLLSPLTDGWDASHGAVVIETTPALVVTHCPLRTVPAGAVNVHGHMHRRADRKGDPHINVAVEQTSYHPIRVSTVLDEARRRLGGQEPRPLAAE